MITKSPLRTAGANRLEIMKGSQMKRYIKAAERGDTEQMSDAVKACEIINSLKNGN